MDQAERRAYWHGMNCWECLAVRLHDPVPGGLEWHGQRMQSCPGASGVHASQLQGFVELSREKAARSFCLQDKWGATALHWAAASNLGAFPQSTRSSSKLIEAPRPYGEVPCAAPSWSTRPLWRLLGPQTAREFWPGLGGSRGGLQLQVREPDSAAGGRGAGQRALKWTLKVTFFKASVSPLFL